MKKILIVSEYFLPKIGGIEKSLYNISKEFINQGYTPKILTTRIDSTDYHENIEGIEIKRFDFKYKNYDMLYPFKFLKKMKKEVEIELNENKYDFIIVRDPISALAIAQLSVKNVVFIPGALTQNFSGKLTLKKGLLYFIKVIFRKIRMFFIHEIEKKAFFNIENVMTYSENFKEEIQKDLYNRKIIVNHPGGPEFKKIEKNLDVLKKELNINQNDVVFVFVGRIVEVKNVDLVIKAFISANIKNSKLIIVGDGEQRKYTEGLVSGDFVDKIIFTGLQKDVEKYYLIADYFLASANYEPFGFVVLEALTYGTPVIGFKRNYPTVKVAVEEMVQDEYNGFLVEDFTVKSFEDTLIKAINFKNNHEAYKAMKKNTLRITEHYNWKSFVNEIVLKFFKK